MLPRRRRAKMYITHIFTVISSFVSAPPAARSILDNSSPQCLVLSLLAAEFGCSDETPNAQMRISLDYFTAVLIHALRCGGQSPNSVAMQLEPVHFPWHYFATALS